MGSASVDGLGHYNPDRSEDPWGRVAETTRMAVLDEPQPPDIEQESRSGGREHEGRRQTGSREGYAGSRLDRTAVWEGIV